MFNLVRLPFKLVTGELEDDPLLLSNDVVLLYVPSSSYRLVVFAFFSSFRL